MKRWLCLSAGIMLVIAVACQDNEHSHEQEDEHAGHAPAADTQTPHGDTLVLTRAQLDLMGISFAPVRQMPFSEGIAVTGRLELFPQDRALVSVPLPAIVEKILVIEGHEVKKGEPIAYVYHPDYIQLQEEYLQLRARLPYLRSEWLRLRQLHEQGYASASEYQRTKAEYESTHGRLAALTATLTLLGIDTACLNEGVVVRYVAVRSPLSGYVHKVFATVRQLLTGGEPIAEIASNQRVHIDLRIYEKDVARVKEGMLVVFRVAGQTHLHMARLYALSPVFEEDASSVHGHALLADIRDADLLPGMYVEGYILSRKDTHLVVPTSAITHIEGMPVLFVAVDTGEVWRLVPVQVRTLASMLDHTAVAGRLEAGALVAVSGTPLLAGELQREKPGNEH